MPLSFERRHLPDPLWYFKRPSGSSGEFVPITDFLLLESDAGAATDKLLLESNAGAGTDALLLETSNT